MTINICMWLYTSRPKMYVYQNAFGYFHDFLAIFCQEKLTVLGDCLVGCLGYWWSIWVRFAKMHSNVLRVSQI